eukprot:g54027.t1
MRGTWRPRLLRRRRRLLLLLLLMCLLSLAFAAGSWSQPFRLPEDVSDGSHWTARCLAGDEAIHIHHCRLGELKNHYSYSDCPPAEELPRHCLISRVPVSVSYRRLACCFRCCAKLWYNWFGVWFMEEQSDLLLRRFWPNAGCIPGLRGRLCNWGGKHGALCNGHNKYGCQSSFFSPWFNRTKYLRWLESVEHPFVMVLYFDGDIPGTSRGGPDEPSNASWLLDHPKILHIFGQNIEPGVTHPKLSVRPRCLYEKDPPVRYLMRTYLVQRQNRSLMLRPEPEPPIKLLCNAMDLKIRPRIFIMRTFPKDVWNKYGCGGVTENHSKFYNFSSYADRVSSHNLLLSPRGWGQETPKPIEASYLGTAPIVAYEGRPRSAHDKLWEGSPTLVLNSWTDLNDQVMSQHLRTVSQRYDEYDIRRMFQPYWLYQYARWFEPETTVLNQTTADEYFFKKYMIQPKPHGQGRRRFV